MNSTSKSHHCLFKKNLALNLKIAKNAHSTIKKLRTKHHDKNRGQDKRLKLILIDLISLKTRNTNN